MRGDICLEPVELKGPRAVLRGSPTAKQIEAATRIVARYTDGEPDEMIEVKYTNAGENAWEEVAVDPMAPEDIEKLRI